MHFIIQRVLVELAMRRLQLLIVLSSLMHWVVKLMWHQCTAFLVMQPLNPVKELVSAFILGYVAVILQLSIPFSVHKVCEFGLTILAWN